jgi:hypothetical protein
MEENNAAEVKRKDGRTFKAELRYVRGQLANPMTDADLSQKFDHATEAILSPSEHVELRQRLWNLADQGSVDAITALFRRRGWTTLVGISLIGLARAAAFAHDWRGVLRRSSAADVLRERAGAVEQPQFGWATGKLVAAAREHVPSHVADLEWRPGSRMSLEQILQYALAAGDTGKLEAGAAELEGKRDVDAAVGRVIDACQGSKTVRWPSMLFETPATEPRDHNARKRLTRREREIGEPVGRGLTNRQIADQLVIAERTVETHLGTCSPSLASVLDCSSPVHWTASDQPGGQH